MTVHFQWLGLSDPEFGYYRHPVGSFGREHIIGLLFFRIKLRGSIMNAKWRAWVVNREA